MTEDRVQRGAEALIPHGFMDSQRRWVCFDLDNPRDVARLAQGPCEEEIERLEADVYRLRDGYAGLQNWLGLAEERIEELEASIGQAPHWRECASNTLGRSGVYGPCDCWKASIGEKVKP